MGSCRSPDPGLRLCTNRNHRASIIEPDDSGWAPFVLKTREMLFILASGMGNTVMASGALNCATERMYVSWVFADKLRMVMSSIMRWRSGEIGFVVGELLSLDCTKRAILADRRLPTDALTSIESTDRP